MTIRRFRAHAHAQVPVALTVVLFVNGAVSSLAASALGQSSSTAPAPAPAPSAPAASPASATPTRTINPAPPLGSAAGAAPTTDPPAAALPPAQLESLVAPIALYPDPLLSQVLVASTYPLEIVEAQQWVVQNQNLKGEALVDAAKSQPWDPSVQALVGLPDITKRMSENVSWTRDLGNAFLAQQSDLLDAVQRLRKKAQDAGQLVSNEQQKVTTKTVEKETVVVVQPAKTEVVYVPTYDPALVWGPSPYPYPAVYYPPPPPVGAMLVSFGAGMMMGAAISGGWGYHSGWGHGHSTVVVNHHNTFVQHNDVTARRNVNARNSTWQHDPSHRGGVGYGNADLSRRYGDGGNAARRSGLNSAGRPSTAGAADRGVGGADRSAGGLGRSAGHRDQSNRGLDQSNRGFEQRGSAQPRDRGFDRSGGDRGFQRSGGRSGGGRGGRR